MAVTQQEMEAVFNRYPTVVAPCSLGPVLRGKMYSLNLPGKIDLDPYPILRGTKATSIQFMGIHKCLFMTFQHPRVLSSIPRMASVIQTIEPWGSVVWMGKLRIRPLRGGTGHCLIWPRHLWTPPAPYREKRTPFKCLIHPVRLSGAWKIVAIDFPTFPRELFSPFFNGHSENQP